MDAQTKNSNFIGMHSENKGQGFVNRDSHARLEEENNQLEFKVIKNDGNHDSLKYLLDLKNIFARQLPKMPKQYIVKLVFDRNHQSMILLKQQPTRVIGGICFREFKNQRFAEIAFLAITSTEQIQGYGTRLMNQLKNQMQRRRVEFLMTYADNLALGYFRKQGFSKDCKMPVERWKGYIKDYEGGTMMQCEVHPTINYRNVSAIIKSQKEFLTNKIKSLCINNIIFDGKAVQKKVTPEGFTRENSQGQQEHFRINPMDIPGVKEGGWSWADHDELMKTKEVSFLLQCQNILQLLKKHQSVWPFREPVSLDDVPDYTVIVKDPIDIKTIEKKLANNEYKDRETFCEDILRMFSNCRLYNQPETVYFRCSNELEDYIKPHLESLKEGRTELNENKRKIASKVNKKRPIDKKPKRKQT